MKLAELNRLKIEGAAPPASNTGGIRSTPDRVWVDDEDFEGTDKLDSSIPDDVPDELKKTNNTQPILKEPDDWLNPKVAKHRGPGA